MAFISLPAAKSAFPSAVCFPGVCSDSGERVMAGLCLCGVGCAWTPLKGIIADRQKGELTMSGLEHCLRWCCSSLPGEKFISHRGCWRKNGRGRPTWNFVRHLWGKLSFVQPVLQMWPALITNSCLMSGICWPLNGQPSCGGWLQGRRAEVCAFSCRWKWYVHI